jgi:(p)ppGpp synthase/HD superfamily hydrolase
MIYTKMTQEAMKICFEVHIEQKDKSGIPYVFHPIHLAEQMETEETIIVALLHDVVEDSDYTIEDLRKKGFSDAVLEAISLMTHADGVNYMDYVKEIKNNPIARAVKLADLRHNSDLTRLKVVDEKALKRRNTYQEAIAFLEE